MFLTYSPIISGRGPLSGEIGKREPVWAAHEKVKCGLQSDWEIVHYSWNWIK